MSTDSMPLPTDGLTRRTGHSPLRGLAGLTAAELRRWFPLRSLVLAASGSGLILGIFAIWIATGNTTGDPRLALLLFPLMAVWTGLLVLVMVAATQGATANEIEQGTAAWILAKPVGRPAFVLSKFIGAIPGVLLGAVAIPGVVAWFTLKNAATRGDTEFSPRDVFDLTSGTKWDRDEFTTLPALSRHVGSLVLISAILLLVVAVMVLLGCVVQSRAAIFLAGLAAPIALLLYGILGQQEIIELTPAWAFDSLIEAIADNPAPVLGPVVVTTVWIVVLVSTATVWFSRKEL